MSPLTLVFIFHSNKQITQGGFTSVKLITALRGRVECRLQTLRPLKHGRRVVYRGEQQLNTVLSE